MRDPQSYHLWQTLSQLQSSHSMTASHLKWNRIPQGLPLSEELPGSYKSRHDNWIKIWPSATCMEVTGVFPVSRGPHFLSEWQGSSEVKEKGQQPVLHQHPAFVSPPVLLPPSLPLAFFHSMEYYFLKRPDVVYATFPSFPRAVVHAPSFISLLLLPPSCCHALGPPRRAHTRIDLTVSAVQPPKSNYYGHNTVIKSNGLLEEAPTPSAPCSTLFPVLLCLARWTEPTVLHGCDVITHLFDCNVPKYTAYIKTGSYRFSFISTISSLSWKNMHISLIRD